MQERRRQSEGKVVRLLSPTVHVTHLVITNSITKFFHLPPSPTPTTMGLPEYDSPFESKARRSSKRILTFVLLGLIFLTGTYFQYRPAQRSRLQVSSSFCAQPSPPSKKSNYSSAYDASEFHEMSAARLSGAVKIPTM